jgi:hypothetical protein
MYAGTPGSPDIPSSGNPFTCGAPGYNLQVPSSGSASDVIGPASWNVSSNQTNVAFRYVVPTVASPTRCGADTDCSGGQKCGLTYSAQSIGSTAIPGSGQLVCGDFAGWFTADQICGTNNAFTNAVNQSNASVKNFNCPTMTSLYQCTGSASQSCYSTGAASTCCGCSDWGTDGVSPLSALPVPTNTSYVTACVNKNTSWTGSFDQTNQPQVYDTVYFLKKSCPSCYVYPYDDASSSFTCTTGTTSSNNTKGYTVEFCPGGSSGFVP